MKKIIFCADKIYEKPKKIICFLVYWILIQSLIISYPILNMYSLKKSEKYKDLYYCLFCESKKRKTKSEYKLFYNTDNYILWILNIFTTIYAEMSIHVMI